MIENLSSYDSATGKKLAMRVFLPGSGERPRAGVVVVHGLGDYIQRYQEVAEMMTGIGIAVVGIDLPGHGETQVPRGKVGRLSDEHTEIEEARSALREMD